MKHLKRLGPAGLAALAACGLATPARATQITPIGTVVSFTATNTLISVHGGITFACNHLSISGRTPAAVSTWQAFPVTLSYGSSCSTSGVSISVTMSEACHTAGGTPTLELMGIGADRAVGAITLPATCDIQFLMPAFNCTMTVQGPQTLGNGTAGFGGLLLTGGTTPTMHSSMVIPDITVPSGGGGLCPSAGTHSGTQVGTYASPTTVHVDGT